jgi:hypothetical protein
MVAQPDGQFDSETEAALGELEALRSTLRLDGLGIRDLIEEGRRF